MVTCKVPLDINSCWRHLCYAHFTVCVQDVEFKEGEKEHFVEIEILYDGEREMREAFTVHMKPDDNMVAEIQVRHTERMNWQKVQHVHSTVVADLHTRTCCLSCQPRVKIGKAAAGNAVSTPEPQSYKKLFPLE